MNRLKLKCYFASTGLHMVLLVVLVVGPGFLAARMDKPEKVDLPVITFEPIITTDKPFSGGGNPEAATPPPALTKPVEPVKQPDPLPEPVKPEPVKPEPVKPEPVKAEPVKPQPEPVKTKPPEPEPDVQPDPKRPPSQEPDVVPVKPKRTLPKVNLTLTERTTTAEPSKAEKEKTAARERARQQQLQQEEEDRLNRQRSDQYASAIGGLRRGLSGRTDLGEFHGPGGGGLPYANFTQAVKSKFFDAWDPPLGIADEKAITRASVTIARDGKVISARITRPSGNSAMDASVRRALDRVKYVAPLPADSKDDERTVPLVFDLTAKRDNG